MNKTKFAREEDGALLVFFALCVAAIFLIAALSFDLGRRASTQTELQSFVDHVALAGAGELDGQVGARERARAAADELISDSFVFGTEADGGAGTTLSGATDYNLFFYPTLPDEDQSPLVGAIADDDITGDAVARFVHISLFPDAGDGATENRVSVPWFFANILSLFSADDLPDEEVGAEAVAGFSGYGCDQAPVFFCAPEGEGGAPSTWDGSEHIGETILLRTGGPGWTPGNFGWLDVESMIGVDIGSPCYGISATPELYACLVTAKGLLTTCFLSGTVDLKTGNQEGIAPAAFNLRFDMFDATTQNYIDEPWMAEAPPAPVVSKGYADGSTCPSQPPDPTTDTMDFPPDDCFVYPGGGCTEYDLVTRYGDSVWDKGRLNYVEQNYSTDADSYNSDLNYTLDWSNTANAAFYPNIQPDELVIGDDDGKTYHIDDPFRPAATYNGVAVPDPLSGIVVPANDPNANNGTGSRWEYYQAEVAYSTTGGAGELINNIPPGDDGAPAYERLGASLPQCSPNPPGDATRRLITAAVVDCKTHEDKMKGKKEDVIVFQWVEIFLQSVFGGTTTPGSNDIYVEIVSSSNFAGQSFGAFHDVVELYR